MVQTNARLDLIDLTDRVAPAVRRARIRAGMVTICSLHTTCALFVNEFQPALLADVRQFLEQLVQRHADWRHNDPSHSDCDRKNADSHLRALLLAPSLSLPVDHGRIVLGQWQRILLAELDGPRVRSLRAQAWGIV